MMEFWLANWGDIATVVGIIVSLGGLGWAIKEARGARSASQAAETAASETRDQIARHLQTVDLHRAIGLIERIKTLHDNDRWEAAREHYQALRAMLSDVIARCPDNQTEFREKLATARAIIRDTENFRQRAHWQSNRGHRSLPIEPEPERYSERIGGIGQRDRFRRFARGNDMIELDQILDGLIRRTTDGKLQWRRSVQDDRFVASVDAISVVVREWTPRLSPRTTYRLEILDENGQTVEVLDHDNSTGEQDEQMERLFVLARRSALNIDAVLQKLAAGLEL